jgi:hypothetical protein
MPKTPEQQLESTRKRIEQAGTSLTKLVMEKNRLYGDSVFYPLGIFTKHVGAYNSAIDNILVRLDDKLGRVGNSPSLRKNDIADIVGYLILLSVSMGWEDFDELLD